MSKEQEREAGRGKERRIARPVQSSNSRPIEPINIYFAISSNNFAINFSSEWAVGKMVVGGGVEAGAGQSWVVGGTQMTQHQINL